MMVRRTLSAFTLTIALVGPALVPTAALAQGVSVRVYDRSHKDYHQWNDDEDRTYRQYLTQNHRSYRPIAKTSRKQQAAYWQFRHK